jgi:NADPH-dependent 2,4-dienoyl-CoA reductase/sulfur reductase-like enzyme
MRSAAYDFVVIGAGPAGLAAAVTGSGLGLRTLLLDEQIRAGGQIYRNVAAVGPALARLLGGDYLHGLNLVRRLASSAAEVVHGAVVWNIDRDLTVTGLHEGQTFQVRAAQLLAATGSIERASPLPGWTLPNVMNAGAAQIALKSSGIVPAGRIVLAGAGPLLLLVATQLLDAGADVVGLVETAPAKNRWEAVPLLPAALAAPSYLAKGLRMIRRLRGARVPWHTAATELRIEGSERAEAVVFAAGGRTHRIAADVVLLHHGVVPNTQISRLLRVEHDWDAAQLAWKPRLDEWGQTSLAGLRIAGDSASIAGALAAEATGALAALGAAEALGRIDAAQRDARAKPLRSALAAQLRIRPFLDALYRPPPWVQQPADDTIVCRCEEVTAGRIREMARLGCQGPNQTKFFSRCGMGPCQGRMCGIAVTQILAAELRKPPGEVGAYRIRPPLKPVPIASIAALADRTAAQLSEEEPA